MIGIADANRRYLMGWWCVADGGQRWWVVSGGRWDGGWWCLTYVGLRPNVSDAMAQPSRPPAVAAPTTVTYVVANAGVTRSGS